MSDEKERDETAQSIDDFFGSLGGGGALKVKLYRFHQRTGKPEFVGTFTSDIDEDFVKENYGGGSFQFRVEERTSEGVKYRGAQTVHIAGAYRDLGADKEEESSQDRVERLELERQELADRLRDQTLEQRFDSFKQEMKGLISELRNPPPQAEQESPIKLAMEIARQMNSVRPHVETPTPQAPDILEILRLGMEMGAGQAGGDDDEGPYMRVLDRLEPFLARLLSPDARAALENPDADPEAPQETQPVDLQSALAQWVPYLAEWAAAGKDPTARAMLVVDELPAHWMNQLDDFLEEQQGSAITTLLGWFPRLAPHRVWTEDFLEALRPGEDQDEDADADAAPVLGTREGSEDVRQEDEDTAD